jgi:SAM-dependent methyltransferase
LAPAIIDDYPNGTFSRAHELKAVLRLSCEEFDWTVHIQNLQDYPGMKQRHEFEILAVLDTLPLKGKVLEIGCSNGRWLRLMQQELGCDGYGIDLNPIGFASDLGFCRGDGFHLPYGNGAFDVVFSLGFLEHFKESDRQRLVSEQIRVLSIGGLLVCSIPNMLSFEGLRVKVMSDLKEGWHHNLITSHQFLGLFTKLQIIYWNYIGAFLEKRVFPKRFSWVEMLLWTFQEKWANSKRLFGTEMLLVARKNGERLHRTTS